MLRVVPLALVALLLVPAPATSGRRDRVAPTIAHLRVDNGGAPWRGDSPQLATVSQAADSLRTSATIRFDLSEPATVTVELARTLRATSPLWQTTLHLDAGPQTIAWHPTTPIPPRTYLVRLRAVDAAGNIR